jgi:protein involved in polysaccharide export with SLBB domain
VFVQIWGSIDAELNLVVNRQGQVNLPKVGAVSLAGVRAGDLKSLLHSKMARIFTNFELNVTLGRLRSIQVYIVGQARQPGTHTVSSPSTLINALFEVGGPSNNGSMRNIQLKRNGRVVGEMDLYRFIARGDRGGDVPLQSGDVIVIPPVGARVAVLGAFAQPAIYELKGAGSIVGEVLALGGGVSVLTRPGKALLERINPASDKPRYVEDFALDKDGLRRPLQDGDILTLFEISPQFSNVVTLSGNVENPVRVPYTAGMRVRDLIPNREALMKPAYYQRKNQLVQYDQTGKSGMDDRDAAVGTDKDVSPKADPAAKAEPADKAESAGKADPVEKSDMALLERGERNRLDEVNWDYAVIERLDRATLSTKLIPFNLGRALADGDEQNNLVLEPGDVVTILSNKDLRVPQDRLTRLVRVEGEVAAPGIYQVESGETLPQFLQRLGGVTRNAYLFGTEFTRESVRAQQQQNLDTVIRTLESQLQADSGDLLANLQSDPNAQNQFFVQQKIQERQLERLKTLRSNGRISLELPTAKVGLSDLPSLPLENGDAIHVPSQPGFVSVVGEVYSDNAVIYRPGKTVGDVFVSAGASNNAEVKNAFVLRADGSVTTARDSNGLFSTGGFDSVELMPGDTVVVPARLDHQTGWTKFVTGLKDWTQILYQMGLGVAAWQVLRE